MKKIILLLTLLTFTFSGASYAKDTAENHIEHQLKSGDAHVSVNGLVCDFCARALEKVFGKQETVEAIDVNLDTKIITINFKSGQTLSNEKITELIEDSGYNVEGIHRVE